MAINVMDKRERERESEHAIHGLMRMSHVTVQRHMVIKTLIMTGL